MTKVEPPNLSHLHESLELYNDLVETSQDLIWQCDAEGRYTYLNSAWETTFGYSSEEMIGKKFSDFQSSEMAERDLREFNRLLYDGTVKGYETIHLAKSGREIHLVLNAKFVRGENGGIIGTRGTAKDITDRKCAEGDLARFLSFVPDLVCIASTDGYFKKLSSEWERVLGYTIDELLAKPFIEFIHSCTKQRSYFIYA